MSLCAGRPSYLSPPPAMRTRTVLRARTKLLRRWAVLLSDSSVVEPATAPEGGTARKYFLPKIWEGRAPCRLRSNTLSRLCSSWPASNAGLLRGDLKVLCGSRGKGTGQVFRLRAGVSPAGVCPQLAVEGRRVQGNQLHPVLLRHCIHQRLVRAGPRAHQLRKSSDVALHMKLPVAPYRPACFYVVRDVH